MPKRFLQQHRAGSCANHLGETCKPAGAGWRWGRCGARYVLYRLPELLATPLASFVFVVEGERCADHLVALNLTATTSAGGAGKWGLGAHEYEDELRDRRVVILPDNDQPGIHHAEDIVASLLSVVAELRSVVLPGLPFKGDIIDWLAAGGSRESLLALVARSPVIRASSAEFPNAVDCRVLSTAGGQC